MTDSRGDKADVNDDTEYPCIKCESTIDAPLEDVCTYLSQQSASAEYNDLVVQYKDVEDISADVDKQLPGKRELQCFHGSLGMVQ